MDNEYNSNLASILESTEDAIISKSLDGTIQSWNKGSEKMFGYTSKEMIGKNISLIIPPEFINDDKNNLHRISNNEIVDRYESTRITKNGEQLFVSLIVSDLKDKAGNITGSYQVARDITSKKKSEAELIIANEELTFQNQEKEKRAAELLIANKELAFQNAEKEKRANELIIANEELAFQNQEKEKRAAELLIANKELAFQNEEKEKRAAELIIANKELSFQTDQKAKRADELIIANEELAFQNQEKEKRAAELLIANKELDFLNKKQQALFASIVNSSDHAMMSKTLDLIITSWNHGAEKIFGYSANEIIGKSSLTLTPPDLQQEEVELTKKIIDGETVDNYKTLRVRKDGTVFNVLLTLSPIKNFEGIIIGASKILRDITEQELAEIKLSVIRKEIANYVYALDQSSIVAVTDQKGIIKYVNDNFLNISKYSREELIGQDHRIISSGYHSTSFIKNLWVTIANGKIWKGELKNKAKDGSTYWVDTTIVPFLDNEGKPYQYMAIRTDITERKKKEQHLKLLESVITNTKDSILITEAEPFDEPGQRILYANEAFTKMTGYTAEEVIGKTPRILQGPKSNRAELKRLGEAIRRWESCEITTINYKKNGEEFWINFTLTPVANEKGWYTHWISIERDVTIRKNEEIQNELIAAISTGFSEPLKLHETLDRTLRCIAKFGDFCFAEAWITSSNQNILKKISNHATTENMSLFIEETKSIDTFIYGEGLTGVVAKTKEITIWGDLENQKLLRRRDAVLKYGLKTIIGLPLLYNNEVIGVLAFGLDHEVIETAKYLSLLKKLGDYLSPEIKRKQLELELNQMFNFAPDLIVIIGLDGRFSRVNPAACELLGYTPAELCAEPYANFIHPEDREKSTNEIAALLETKLTYNYENRYITKSGKIKWLAWNAIYVNEDNTIYAVAKDITEKKELEDLLQKVNELARIGGWEVDLQNNTVFWSDITKEIHEVASDYIPVIQTAVAFYKKGSNRTKITEYIEQAINTGKSWDDELQIVTAKGNDRWVRIIGEAEFVNGNCIRIYGSFQDIDERKKAESKLIENENYLRTILDTVPECVKVLNSKGELLYMNPAGLAIIEADNEQQVLGTPMMDLVNKKYQIGFNRLSIEVFKGNSGTFEFEITGLKGRQRWLETHAVPLKDTTGKIVNLLGATRDITLRKKAEEAVKNTEERRKLIMNAALDAIICIDKDGMITFWNPQAEQIFGWSENEVMGKLLSSIIIPEHFRSMHDNGMKNYLKTGEGKALNVLLQLSAIRRNGNEFPIELTVLPIRQDGEEFFCAFIRDITERKTHEDQLLQLNKDLNKQSVALVTSNKELEQFAYVASHDLQEPLRMVTSFLTLLEKRYNDVLDEKGLKYINFAVEGSKSMRQIILDILEFSRINNSEEKYESIDLKDIINDISLLQSKLIKEKKAKIIFEELPKVYSIRHYLSQLFQNIISNALKYSKEDVPLQITINSKEYKNYYRIAINDNGIGIEKEYYEKIFIIFQRLHGKEKYQGNGMGLAIAKKIVDKLNGEIWVKSKAGIGSTFYIKIPKKIKL